jgi:hypothetical protein
MGKDKEVGALEGAAEEETLALGAVFIKDSEPKECKELKEAVMANATDVRDPIRTIARCKASIVSVSK